jgi:2-keto-4-pentenoate hydratase/2-oxohepta-3-ene-1,7-dioic acid hydratase in catechol pathway
MSEIPHGLLLGRFSVGRRTFVGGVEADRVQEASNPTMAHAIENGFEPSGKTHRRSDLKTLAPVDRPSKVICIGLNYRSHIKEMGAEMPKVPIIFSKAVSAIVGPGDDIVLPHMSSRVDYEGESAIVIGSRAQMVKDGAKHIFGYTCINDVTARDLQKSDVDWTRAKGFDTFAPIGPLLSGVPPKRVTTMLNGKVVQDSPLADRVFGDAALVEYISSIMTLEPGDIIATGTPSGISPMKHGDMVEVELDGVGRLRNQVVRAR